MPYIEIPIDMMPRNHMRKFCKYYDCILLNGRRGDAYYKIISEDATNFFWMGANANNETLNSLYRQIRELGKKIK